MGLLVGKTSLEVGDRPHPHGMRVPSGEQRRPGRRTQRRDVEVRVSKTGGCQSIDVRCGDVGSVAAQLGEAGVIEQYHNDVRGVFSGMWRLIEPWLGLGDGSTDTSFETFGPPHEISGTNPNSSSSGSGSIPSIRR